VFAMVGGAWASSGNGGQATASAKKGPPGPRGKTGKTGPAGPAGPSGPQGSVGPVGPKGDKGEKGDTGEKGAKGDPGTNGKDGKTGFTEVLPVGKTETGSWSMFLNGSGTGATAISFSIPMKEGKGNPNVKIVPIGGTPPTECENAEHTGTASGENPEATPGFLCIYSVTPPVLLGAGFNPLGVFKAGSEAFGYSPNGAVIAMVGGTANGYGQGSWAITGE
jgi:collagen triple helix repeat protein